MTKRFHLRFPKDREWLLMYIEGHARVTGQYKSKVVLDVMEEYITEVDPLLVTKLKRAEQLNKFRKALGKHGR